MSLIYYDNMKLKQQPQTLSPTKIKNQKTIPPELLVDIFKTINTYSTELAKDRSKDPDAFYIILLKGLWILYAEKLMTSSSIVYLSAGDAFRQCKQKLLKTMSQYDTPESPDEEEHELTAQMVYEDESFDFVAKLTKSVELDEINKTKKDHPHFWIKNYIKLYEAKKEDEAKISRMEETLNRRDGFLTAEEQGLLGTVSEENVDDDTTRDFWLRKYMHSILDKRLSEKFLKIQMDSEKEKYENWRHKEKKHFKKQLKKEKKHLEKQLRLEAKYFEDKLKLEKENLEEDFKHKKEDFVAKLQSANNSFENTVEKIKSEKFGMLLNPVSIQGDVSTSQKSPVSLKNVCSVSNACIQIGNHYGAYVCMSCADFFRNYTPVDKCNKKCEGAKILNCKYCRYAKCEALGMKMPTPRNSPNKGSQKSKNKKTKQKASKMRKFLQNKTQKKASGTKRKAESGEGPSTKKSRKSLLF